MHKSKDKRMRFSIKHQLALIRMLVSYIPETRRIWTNNAQRRIAALELKESEKDSLFEQFCRDYKKYRQTFQEYYYCYRFPELSEKQKSEFLTMRDTQFILRKYRILFPEQWVITSKKDVFLQKYAPFIHRNWMLVDSSTSIDAIQNFINRFDVIAKPTNSESGKGVYKILKGKGDAHQVLEGKLPILLEECLKNVDELAEFHPSSLNTVRVVTIANGTDVKIFGAILRTGNNSSVFDNADAGGYFAEVDTHTGVIISNGVNEMGDEVEAHPISGKVFKGSFCPMWREVIEICKKAALYIPETTIIAWDVAITTNGVELIEANSVPSIYIHQVPLHKGVRQKFYQQMAELGLPYKDVMMWAIIISRLTDNQITYNIARKTKRIIQHILGH